MAGDGEKVQLYVYDLSNGLAAQLSPMLLGKRIEAIYHTAVVVGGVEHFYGGGIQEAVPGHTPYGRPIQVLDLGTTYLDRDVRQQFLVDISERFSPEAYNLFHHNCNNFSDELATFLTGEGIPPHITSLPAEVLATPFGQSIAPMMASRENAMGINTPMQHQHAVTRQHPQPEALQDVTLAAGRAAPAALSAAGAAIGSSPPTSAPRPAATPSAAATPALPPTPRKAAAGMERLPPTGGSPSVTAATAGLSLASPETAAPPARAGGGPGAQHSEAPHTVRAALKFDTPAAGPRAGAGAAASPTEAPVSAQAGQATLDAARAAGAAAAARASGMAAASAPHLAASADQAQAAFQAALLAEFTRIRATGVSANEAAALALRALQERAPALVAARG